MSKKVYILASPFCSWNEHLTFDAGILELFHTLNAWKIIFVWEKNHILKIKNILPNLPVTYHVSLYSNRVFLWFYVIFSVFFLQFFNARRKVIFLSFEHPNIIFLISILFRNSIWFLHTYWWRNKIISFFKKLWFRLFLLRNKSVVLWEWIYNNMPFYKNNFFLHHPIPSFISNFRNIEKKNQVVVFPSHKHRFWNQEVTSYFLNKLRSYGLEIVSLWWSDRVLELHDYYSQLAQSQFCIFLSSPDDYALRCSWSLFDAMGTGLFICGIASDMSRSLVRDFWDIGFFVNHIDQINNSMDNALKRRNEWIDIWDLILKKNILLISQILL